MRSKEFIAERAEHHVSLPSIQRILRTLKPKLWDQGLNISEIVTVLESALRLHFVMFEEVPDTVPESEYATVGLNGGYYNPHTGVITVGITWHIEEVLNGDTRVYYEDFTRLLASIIAHELKHKNQVEKSEHNADNVPETDDIKAYLADHRELEAYAAQAAAELQSQLSVDDILQKLKTDGGRDELSLYSEGLKVYHSYFYGSPVLNKFISKVYSIISSR